MNAIQCKLCDDLIASKHRHDFVTCSCGAVSVDGGKDYSRVIGEGCNWVRISEDDLLEHAINTGFKKENT